MEPGAEGNGHASFRPTLAEVDEDGSGAVGESRELPPKLAASATGALATELVSLRDAPAWLVSLIVHTVLIISLALLYASQELPQVISLDARYAEDLGVQLEDDAFDLAGMDEREVAEPALSLDNLAAFDPLARPPEIIPRLEGFTPTDPLAAPTLGLSLTGREKGMKEALLAKYGGTATTEAAVAQALAWLSRNQRRDGLWSLQGPYTDGATGENEMAATAMALLAFQGAGNTHLSGTFRDHVRRGWNVLLKQQDADGNFDHGSANPLYTQAQVTIAICEIYGMTQDPQFLEPAQRAIDYAVNIQSSEGGWRYRPGVDADTSVVGWFLMGLQSARMAGLRVPDPTLERTSGFLDTVAADGGSYYRYHPSRRGYTPAMTAEALLCRQYLGWTRDNPHLDRGARLLLENPINWQQRNVYYWYYATQVLHHMEGEYWDSWNEVMREVLPRHQVRTGREAGSWAPEGDQWGDPGGRLYVTCMCAFMLEVYYRHLPIYSYRLE